MAFVTHEPGVWQVIGTSTQQTAAHFLFKKWKLTLTGEVLKFAESK